MNNTNILVPVSNSADIYSKNIGECLKQTTQFSQTVYQNICTGEQYSVPLGFWDFIPMLLLSAFAIAFITMIWRIIKK